MLNDKLEQFAKEFAEKNALDFNLVKLSMAGIFDRVNHALAKGEALTPKLIEAAILHWHKTQQQMYEDLLTNKDGALDKLSQRVYTQLNAKSDNKENQ